MRETDVLDLTDDPSLDGALAGAVQLEEVGGEAGGEVGEEAGGEVGEEGGVAVGEGVPTRAGPTAQD